MTFEEWRKEYRWLTVLINNARETSQETITNKDKLSLLAEVKRLEGMRDKLTKDFHKGIKI